MTSLSPWSVEVVDELGGGHVLGIFSVASRCEAVEHEDQNLCIRLWPFRAAVSVSIREEREDVHPI